MNNKTSRSAGLRAFNALCALAIIAGGLYMLFAGFEFLALAAVCCALAGAATPVVASGEGVWEMISGVFEALADGIVAIFEAITGMVLGIFG